MIPPLPGNVVGNLVGYFAAKIEASDQSGHDLKSLVAELRK